MAVIISMLRGVNLAGRNRIRMDALRALYESLGLRDVQTYVQSGNVVFRSIAGNPDRLARKIEDALDERFGFRPDVILRTPADLRKVIVANPFAKRRDMNPGKLLVTFLAREPGEKTRQALLELQANPEELHISAREVYIYFPNGMGRSKIPWADIGRILNTPATARNWNTVQNLRAIAEKLEGSPNPSAP